MTALKPMDEPIRIIYMKLYPDDPCGARIQEGATFRDMMKALRARIDVYLIIGTGDSLVRERLFAALAHRSGKSYEWIYNCWISGPAEANRLEKEKR